MRERKAISIRLDKQDGICYAMSRRNEVTRVIVVRKKALKHAMERRQWKVAMLAVHSGLSDATIYNLLAGKPASEKSIAALLRAFPELSFDDLFEVVDREKVAS